MTVFSYALDATRRPQIGLVALQTDETIEDEFRRLLCTSASLLVSRVPSSPDVTPETLRAMAGSLTQAASLFPPGLAFDALGYGCTSGAAQIGVERVAELVRAGAEAKAVTEPVSALVAACAAMGVRRLALLSPYVESVSERLRAVLSSYGVETPIFGSFAEASEARVARISAASIIAAAEALVSGSEVDALFLSCTNLRTLDVIEPLEARLGVPVLSSNLVFAWRLAHLAGAPGHPAAPGRLFKTAPPL